MPRFSSSNRPRVFLKSATSVIARTFPLGSVTLHHSALNNKTLDIRPRRPAGILDPRDSFALQRHDIAEPDSSRNLPVTGPIFEEYVASFGLSDRFKFIPGNFFTDDLPSADVLSMGHILHDWNLEQKQTLIQKAYDALPEGGVLLVFESIIDDNHRENAFGLLLSLTMLIETPGGFDYTGADCFGWMKEAGFRETRVEHLAGSESMVIGTK